MVSDNLIFCASLAEAFASVSMVYPSKGIEPGKLARFSSNDKPNDTAGWCKLFSDGVGAVFGCNRVGTSFTWQKRDSNAPAPSKEERQAALARFEQAKLQGALERADQYKAAAVTAASLWRETIALDPAHDYVTRKGITPFLARQDAAGSIVLPVYDADGVLQTLQFIYSEAKKKKKFMYQGKAQGGRLFIGNPVDGRPILLGEGWAKACSLHQATGYTVVICFSADNMALVAGDLRRQFPASVLCIAGDLDAHGKGLKAAQAAAAAGAPATVVLPVFADGRNKGDWDDLHRAEGLDVVRNLLAAVPDTSKREVAPFMAPSLPKTDARDGTSNTRPLTEQGNAHRLMDLHGNCLRYVYDAKSWIAWGSGAWRWDAGDKVRSLAANLPLTIYPEGANHINDAEFFARWARKSQEQKTIKAAVDLLSDFASVRLPLTWVDANHFAIGFNQARQVIDLCTGVTRAATPADYITKSLGVETIGDASKAVRWLKFLEQVFNGDRELIDWMQRFCGYLLTGSTQEQVFLFLFGHGANGKSVFIEVLKYIMGDYCRAIASETLSESKRQAGGATPDLAALIGARMVLCSETEDNTALAESLVKSLVSGDSMAVRQLYAAPVQFSPHFKLLMAGNHKPVVRGNDNGIWRRIRMVPFNRTFSPDERDPNLLARLKVDAPDILAWMVEGCIEWQRRGLADTPALIRHATEAYQEDQDITGRWLEECTIASAQGATPSADLYANYWAWSVANGFKPASSNALGRRLEERKYKRGKSAGVRVWFGLSLTDSRITDAKAYSLAKGGD